MSLLFAGQIETGKIGFGITLVLLMAPYEAWLIII